jgi:hypothetical protein
MNLFTQNSDLKKGGIYGWTLPAHNVTLSNGEKFNTCPNAGVCGAFCYAKTGTYQFSNVKKAHLEKLELVLNNLNNFENIINEELKKKKYDSKFIRVHDAGDFFSKEYAISWINIANKNKNITFYSYTKEVLLFKNDLADLIPENFILIYSFGGKQDKYIDVENDRHSDVFYSIEELIEKGYFLMGDDDKESAINENKKIGLFRNNIPHIIKKMNGKNFSTFKKV